MKRFICLLATALMVLAFAPATYADDEAPADDGINAQAWFSGGNVFCGNHIRNGQFNIYKDFNGKDTYNIYVADGASPGEKYKVIAPTTYGDSVQLTFRGRINGWTSCSVPSGGRWPGYRYLYTFPPNGGYFKLLKIKRIRGSGSTYHWLTFVGSGDRGWRQTSGYRFCGW